MPEPKQKKNDKTTLPAIRCSLTERQRINAKAKKLNMSVSAYVRKMSLAGKIVIKENANPQFDFALVDQLRRIGVNLNQQTKRFNSTGHAPPELSSLCEKMDAVLDFIIDGAKIKKS